MNIEQYDKIRPVLWENNALVLIDQRLLPNTHEYITYTRIRDVADAIRDMVVRGAPAIGISAAFGIVLGARHHYELSSEQWKPRLEEDIQYLAASRPTAVNLFWAIARMRRKISAIEGDPTTILLEEAHQILQEDILANKTMGKLGAQLIAAGSRVLTHCNAGALATGGYGTALGVIRSAYAQGLIQHVYADETRPWMQGARLTAWEMMHDDIPVTLQTDSSAAYLMQQGKIDWVIVGSDRITANGDVANKIGTYNLAVLARYHNVKFMVAAPTSTIDMQLTSGTQIPIEQRNSSEVTCIAGHRIAANDVNVINPAFDVTPAELVDVIVTERGVVQNPNAEKMQKLMTS